MSKFNFLNNLEEESPKVKYQLFEAEMGFERVSVFIPLQSVELFEAEANEKKPKSKTSLEKIAKKHGGHVE